MDLILWRHAEAVEHPDPVHGQPGDPLDLKRRLTARGDKQAARMAAWLDRQLPEAARVLTSPALRAEHTALALGRKYRVHEALAPEADPLDLLEAVQWPKARWPTVVVGHQPTLGRALARLLGLSEEDCPVRKGSVWWVRQRQREGAAQTVLVTVQIPELL